MRPPLVPIVLVTLGALTACGNGTDDEPRATGSPATTTASPTPAATGPSAAFKTAEGTEVGTVSLTDEGGAVVVRVDVRNLEPGFHGLHVHAVGRCDGPDFATAGGHHAGDGAVHGTHDGDLPSLLVNEDGTARLEVRDARFTVAELDDADGAAVVVHAGPDNFANIPSRYGTPDEATRNTGDAGERVACAVLFPADTTASPAQTTTPDETASPTGLETASPLATVSATAGATVTTSP